MARAAVPEGRCTNCGELSNAAASVNTDEWPSPGHFAICFECGHLMVYGDELTLREPTDAEVLKAAGDPTLIAAQRAIAASKKTP
jgi:hypothetical protein